MLVFFAIFDADATFSVQQLIQGFVAATRFQRRGSLRDLSGLLFKVFMLLCRRCLRLHRPATVDLRSSPRRHQGSKKTFRPPPFFVPSCRRGENGLSLAA
jgi:hypothetical protein